MRFRSPESPPLRLVEDYSRRFVSGSDPTAVEMHR